MQCFFSFNKIHRELQRQKSLDYPHLKSMTEWEWLCKHYLHSELIGDYNDVEWEQYDITANNLFERVSLIDNVAETLRLLTYMRDHAYRFVSNYGGASSVILRDLEDAVCTQINTILRKENDTNFNKVPNLRKIVELGEIPNTIIDNTFDVKSLNTSSRIIVEYLPHTNDDSHWDVFHYVTIIKVARICLHDFVESIDHTKKKDRQALVEGYITGDKQSKLIEHKLCEEENRLLLGKILPVSQVLFALCVYLEIDPLSNRWRDYCDKYREAIMERLRSTYHVSRVSHKLKLCKDEIIQQVNGTNVMLESKSQPTVLNFNAPVGQVIAKVETLNNIENERK